MYFLFIKDQGRYKYHGTDKIKLKFEKYLFKTYNFK